MRRLVRRFGAWLVRWADHGAQLHVCFAAYSDFLGQRTQQTVLMELRPGDRCHYCGETNK